MTIIIALIAFGIMIGIHEAGHLVAAKLSGVLVHEFAIGMGPKLFSWQGKETAYSLRLLPIGGFCNLEGENGGSDDRRAFCKAPKWQKIVILAAGAVMNLVLGFVLLLFFYAGQPAIADPVAAGIIPNTYAEQIGLQEGDTIVKMGNTKVNFYPDIKFFLLRNGDKPFDLTVNRGGEKIQFKNFKPYTDENGAVYIGIQVKSSPNTVLKTIKNSFYLEIFMGKLLLTGLWDLVTGNVSVKEASGPVGIVKEIGNAAKTGWTDLLYIVALITVNLGLFNLLPIPALDGGRILFVLISILIRRPVPEKVETAFHATGMLLLLLLMLLVTFNDVGRLF